MRRYCLGLCLGLLALFSASEADAARLTVSAAVSLREVFQAIAREFRAIHPEYRIALNLASSGHLLRQIERGAPVDVFAPAGARPMDILQKSNLIKSGTRRVFTTNRLVLVCPKGNSIVKSFAALGEDTTGRFVIGNPNHVPAGFYAKQVLESLSYWKKLSPKLILAEHVRQVLDYVVRGEVDAGLVYRTDALLERGKVDLVAEAPPGSHSPIEYPIAVVADTRYPKQARVFVKFVLGSKARSILARAGFGGTR